MKIRKNDFLEVFLYGVATSSVIIIIIQLLYNIFHFLFSAKFPGFEFNCRFFFSFEIFFILLFALIGFVYIFWFNEYKIDQDGRERKRRRF